MTDPTDDLIAQLVAGRELSPDTLEKIKSIVSGQVTAGDAGNINQHVTDLIKTRTMQLTGDRTHASIRTMFKMWEDVDKPRKYDFQELNVHEQQCIRFFVPSFMSMFDKGAGLAIKGEGECVIKLEHRCFECEKPLFLHVNGVNVEALSDGPCEDHSNYKVVVDFPTGEVVVGDAIEGIREWEDGNVDSFAHVGSINYQKGTHETTQAWAAEQVGFFFVGNTCPSIALDDQGRLLMRPDERIPYTGDDSDDQWHDEENTNPENLQGCVRLATVTTDLWWATMVDLANWEHMVAFQDWTEAQMNRHIKQFYKNKQIIKVKPGKWEFFYQSVETDDDMLRRITGTWLEES